MKTAGIIAEYNPLHNGHKYHIESTRKETGADYVIVAMSGNFVQRGAPAMTDKFSRAKSALMAGADLVVQIPPYYSLSSAEFFAKGGVSTLINTGVCEYLSFGSESGNIDDLKKVAKVLAEEPAKFKTALKKYLKAGDPFPGARMKALIDCYPDMANLHELLATPNNILGIEYLKYLIKTDSHMKPVTFKRVGAGSNDPYFPGQPGISSKAIREAVSYGSDISTLKDYMTEDSFRSLKDNVKKNLTVTEDDFSQMLIYKLLSERNQGYTKYTDVSEDLSDRIVNNLDKYTGFSDFCNLLKTRNITYTRVSRALFHILLNMTEESYSSVEYTGVCPYIRVLGFRKEAEALVSEMKTKAVVPIITGYNDAAKSLYDEPMKQLMRESAIEDLYFSVQTLKSKVKSKPDMSRPLIVL